MRRPLTIYAAVLSFTVTSAPAQEWSACTPSLNVARTHAGVCTDQRGNIYIIGGSLGPGTQTASVEMLAYDVTARAYADSWIEIAPLNTARSME